MGQLTFSWLAPGLCRLLFHDDAQFDFGYMVMPDLAAGAASESFCATRFMNAATATMTIDSLSI
jgi:hypothetical protein